MRQSVTSYLANPDTNVRPATLCFPLKWRATQDCVTAAGEMRLFNEPEPVRVCHCPLAINVRFGSNKERMLLKQKERFDTADRLPRYEIYGSS